MTDLFRVLRIKILSFVIKRIDKRLEKLDKRIKTSERCRQNSEAILKRNEDMESCGVPSFFLLDPRNEWLVGGSRNESEHWNLGKMRIDLEAKLELLETGIDKYCRHNSTEVSRDGLKIKCFECKLIIIF